MFVVKCTKGKYAGKYLKKGYWKYEWTTLKGAYQFKSIDMVNHWLDDDWIINDLTSNHTINGEVQIMELTENMVSAIEYK